MVGPLRREEHLSDSNPDLLMQGYQKGDAAATSKFIKCVSPALYAFLNTFESDRRHADDLLQETWLHIHKARHSYRPGEPVMPWLFAIARHVRVDAYRRRRFEQHEQLQSTVIETPVHPSGFTNHLPPIESLLAMLPPGQREVISMLKVSGLSLEEVARATSPSVGSVKQKAHRAYERLRRLLTDLRPPQPGTEGAP